MTDDEFLEGEDECPVYGKHLKDWFCERCRIGTDGTAECKFRLKEVKLND